MGAQIRKHLAVCRTLTDGKAWWILVQEAINNKLFMIHRHSWREPCAAPSLDSRFSCSAKREVDQIIQGRAPAFRLEWGRILLVTAKLENPSPINFVSHQFDAIICGRCFTRSKLLLICLTELPSNPKSRREKFKKCVLPRQRFLRGSNHMMPGATQNFYQRNFQPRHPQTAFHCEQPQHDSNTLPRGPMNLQP
jgi:hypothetical protein